VNFVEPRQGGDVGLGTNVYVGLWAGPMLILGYMLMSMFS